MVGFKVNSPAFNFAGRAFIFKMPLTHLPLESLNFLQIVLHSWMSCRTCSSRASCCLFNFWKKVNRLFIRFVVSSLIQFRNASKRSFSFSISISCWLCASRNLLSKPRIFSLHSVPSSPFFATFCQLCTSVRIWTFCKYWRRYIFITLKHLICSGSLSWRIFITNLSSTRLKPAERHILSVSRLGFTIWQS